MMMRTFLAACTILFAALFGTNAHAHLIGVDFGPSSSATPTDWTGVPGVGTYNLLGTETGGSTVVGLVVTGIVGGNPLNFDAAVTAGTIPNHTNSLANIKGNVYRFGITAQLELKISGLEAGRSYNVWVFGLRTFAGSLGLAQDVDIQPGATHFDQVTGSGNLFVNNAVGNSTLDLSTYATAITASAGGEITIAVTADGGDNIYAVAGVAIDVPTPTVTTQAVTRTGTTTATGNGNITDLGDPNPTQHGVCWNTTGTPTTADNKTEEGAAGATGAFTSSMTGLSPGTTYYVRAYATNDVGTEYGSQVSFTTNTATPVPTLNEWGLIVLSLLLIGVGYITILIRKGASA